MSTSNSHAYSREENAEFGITVGPVTWTVGIQAYSVNRAGLPANL